MSRSHSNAIVGTAQRAGTHLRRFPATGLFVILALSEMEAGASQGSVPKVFKGIPQEKGQWRMELFTDQPPVTAGGGPPKPKPGFSLCMDSLAKMAKSNTSGGQSPGSAGLGKCHSAVTDDDTDRAVIETHCENNQHYRTDVIRSGPKEFLLDVSGTANGQPFGLKSRYTYEGPCTTQPQDSGKQN